MPDHTHAGGVVVRRDEEGPEEGNEEGNELLFLLVQSSKNPSHWVLPKGHIDPGETAEQTAVREVREESGVVGEIAAELGVDAYTLAGVEVRAVYFLMRFAGTVPPEEDREVRWLSLEEARRTLSYPSSRELLAKAAVEFAG